MTGKDIFSRYSSFWCASTGEQLPPFELLSDRAKSAWEYLGSGLPLLEASDPAHEMIGSLRRRVVQLESLLQTANTCSAVKSNYSAIPSSRKRTGWFSFL
jgi:hypothetical protein